MMPPVVILAGGLGIRLSEETADKPKPMVCIGHMPILWHIMKYYHSYGCKEFVIALGYMGDYIKDYFSKYRELNGSLSIDFANDKVTMHKKNNSEDWVIHLLETGRDTMTGGRIRMCSEFLGERRFMATYGDGLSSINISELLRFHESTGTIATLSAVRPPARFGSMTFSGELVSRFNEKPQTGEGWINGGYFVMEPEVSKYIIDDDAPFEREPMEKLASTGELSAYKHEGFWQCVDTHREKVLLEQMVLSGKAPWIIW